jgi:hypothetical protein
MMSDSFMIIEADLCARPLSKQHAVAGLDVERVHPSIVAAAGIRPDREDFALHRLFLGDVWNDDPARRLRLLFHSPDQHVIAQKA